MGAGVDAADTSTAAAARGVGAGEESTGRESGVGVCWARLGQSWPGLVSATAQRGDCVLHSIFFCP